MKIYDKVALKDPTKWKQKFKNIDLFILHIFSSPTLWTLEQLLYLLHNYIDCKKLFFFKNFLLEILINYRTLKVMFLFCFIGTDARISIESINFVIFWLKPTKFTQSLYITRVFLYTTYLYTSQALLHRIIKELGKKLSQNEWNYWKTTKINFLQILWQKIRSSKQPQNSHQNYSRRYNVQMWFLWKELFTKTKPQNSQGISSWKDKIQLWFM